MSSERAQELLEKGLEAAEIGDNESAAELLKEVVELDGGNVEAWLGLAKVLEDPDERRIALTTVLRLDPSNAYAKRSLAETQKTVADNKDAEDFVPGIKRRELRLVVLGLIAFTVVVCGLSFAVLVSATGQRNSTRQSLTQAVVALTRTNQAFLDGNQTLAVEQTQVAINATETSIALVSPTPTASNTPDLPPTFTPSPTPTEVTFRVGEVPPSNLSGRIIGWGGRNPVSDEFLNLISLPAGGAGSFERIGQDLIQHPVADAVGSRYIYMRLVPQGTGNTVRRVDPQALNNPPEDLNVLWSPQQLDETRLPSVSANGQRLVFMATEFTTQTTRIYVTDFANSNTRPITNDNAGYDMPAISPDGTQVVAVRDSGAGPDLVLINLEDFTQTPLTNTGNTLREAWPRFAPDGVQIVYSGGTTDEDHDLYILRLLGDGTAGSVPVVTTTADEIYASFSPDNQYLVYSANATGNYNIFIFDIAGRITYQLTAEEDNFYPGVWLN